MASNEKIVISVELREDVVPPDVVHDLRLSEEAADRLDVVREQKAEAIAARIRKGARLCNPPGEAFDLASKRVRKRRKLPAKQMSPTPYDALFQDLKKFFQ